MSERVMLLTGASSGIGEALAHQAVAANYRLVLAARRQGPLDELAQALGGHEHAMTVTCDVAEWSEQEAMVAAALERFGRIDAVVANAGFGAARGFTNETPEHWRDMILTNVLGVALTIRASIDAIRESKGHFVLTGSVAGHRAVTGSVYSATKWAVTGLAEGLRQELNGTGARTTLISPGAVDTPFFDNPPAFETLQPQDVARAVMYALSQPEHVDTNQILIRPTAQEL
jgi:NADP-dependent 3-hydroxy acid dehydrogenase YdfG